MAVRVVMVGLAGAAGALARYGIGQAVGARSFPWATLGINVLGSFVIGLAAAIAADGRAGDAAWVRPFVMVGLCGGFTTFSAFSLQTVELLQGGEVGWALAYALGSVALCLLATWAGLAVGR